MSEVNLKQGTQEWHDHRDAHFNASDAPAMLNISPYKSRAQLVKERATGCSEPIPAALQKRFDDGHRFERLARPIAEGELGDELYPVTVTEGKLSASLDGKTFDGAIIWEHKTLNDTLRKLDDNGLPDYIHAQIQQQLICSGAKKCLFTASLFDDNDQIIEKVDCWAMPDPAMQKRIIDGWKQFEEDVANYEHVEAVHVAVAEAQTALPSVTIQVNGSIALIDNLDVFGEALQRYVADINQKPETDQDFANLEASVKTLKKAEDALLSAESGALAQTESIDVMRRKVANFHETARTTRLVVERLVKSEKENRRNAILQGGKDKLAEHIAKLNARVNNYMPAIAADFVGAMKGKKTMASLQDAVDTTLAHAKIEANEQADLIEANLNLLKDKAADHKFLFSDTRDLIMKAPDDLAAVISMRISEHEKAESERLAAEQARIRKEEEDRANAQIAADEARIRADEKAKIEAAKPVITEQPAPVVETVTPLATESENKKNQKAVNNEAIRCFMEAGGFTDDQAKTIVTLIAKGVINNVSIKY